MSCSYSVVANAIIWSCPGSRHYARVFCERCCGPGKPWNYLEVPRVFYWTKRANERQLQARVGFRGSVQAGRIWVLINKPVDPATAKSGAPSASQVLY